MARTGSCCELCSSVARMFCESDQARLCWDCDEKVHAANFLVEKHTRTALCNVCHSLTPWKASGPKLGRTISVCGVCVARSARAGGGSAGNGGVAPEEKEVAERSRNVRIGGDGGGGGGYFQREELDDDDYDDGDSEGDDDDDDDDDDSGNDDGDFDVFDEDDEDDDENQVVPYTSSPPPPASATSTSCSEEEDSSSFGGGSESVSMSRFRELAFLSHSNGEIGGRGSSTSSMAARSRAVALEDEENFRIGFVRPWKHRRVAAQP